MRRLASIAGVALAAGVLAGTASPAGTSGVHLTKVAGPAFPVRTYVLSLSKVTRLKGGDVHVTENGGPVVDPTLVPAKKAAENTFGVVLALDSSYSMKGKPLASAIAAEQAFAAQRNPNEQLGAVDFNRETTTVLPLTTSREKISQALATPPKIAPGTHIYDGVAQAEAMLAAAHITSGSIIVLSDGADTGSTKSLSQVVPAARRANIRIYTIGLDDASYDPHTLKALAKAGHGDYAKASSTALAPLFDRLSRIISSEYLLQYKSLAQPNKPVLVRVQVHGIGSTSTAYKTPALAITTTTSAPNKSSGNGIWGSTLTLIVIALLAAAAVALLVIGILRPTRSALPARMSEFVSIRGLQRDNDEPKADEDSTGENTWLARLGKTLEIAEIHIEPEMLVAVTFAVTALVFLLIYAVTGSIWWGLLALVVPYLSREWVIRTLKSRRDRFAEQLPDALQVIASALRSGHSFAGALAVVVESGSEPMKSEMQRVVADEQLGVPIQNSLGVVAERMASSDVEQLALVAQLQREAGGDAAEVVDRVAETVRERFDLKRLIQTLTMQGRMSRWIVTALPIVIVLAVLLENRHYFHPLIATTGGRVVIGLAVAWAVAGSFVIKKIVEIEV